MFALIGCHAFYQINQMLQGKLLYAGTAISPKICVAPSLITVARVFHLPPSDKLLLSTGRRQTFRLIKLLGRQGRRGTIQCRSASPRRGGFTIVNGIARRVHNVLESAYHFFTALPPGERALAFLQCLRPSLLDRWLLVEMLGPCMMAVAVFMSLGVSLGALVELVREVVVSGLPLRVALGAALLQMPRFLNLSLPFSSLAGSLLSMSRMQADSELVALASVGVSPLRLMKPALMLGALTASLALFCGELLVPYASKRAQELVQSALTTEMHAYSVRECVTHRENHPKKVAGSALQRLWYADRLQRGSMRGMSILEMSPTGELARIVMADSCDWNWDLRCWQLHDATILQVCARGFPTHMAQLAELEVPMSNVATTRSYSSTVDTSEMPRQLARAHIRDLRQRLRQHQGATTTQAAARPAAILSRMTSDLAQGGRIYRHRGVHVGWRPRRPAGSRRARFPCHCTRVQRSRSRGGRGGSDGGHAPSAGCLGASHRCHVFCHLYAPSCAENPMTLTSSGRKGLTPSF
eukprot:jgi/Mesvir1/21042/Mv08089-RA.3